MIPIDELTHHVEFENYFVELLNDFQIGKLSRIEFENLLRQFISRKIYVFSVNTEKERIRFIENYCNACQNKKGCESIGVGVHGKKFYPNEWITKYNEINCNNFEKL